MCFVPSRKPGAKENLELTVVPCSEPEPHRGIVIVKVLLAAGKRNPLKLPKAPNGGLQ